MDKAMRVRFHIFTILLSTVLATAWADVSVVYDSLINVLDNSIDNRKPYIEAKERHSSCRCPGSAYPGKNGYGQHPWANRII